MCLFVSGWLLFVLSDRLFQSNLRVFRGKLVIFGRFGQYDVSPGYLGYTMGAVILRFLLTKARVCRSFRSVSLSDAVARFNACHHQHDSFRATRAKLWVAAIKHLEGFHPVKALSLIHISEPTRLGMISYAV